MSETRVENWSLNTEELFLLLSVLAIVTATIIILSKAIITRAELAKELKSRKPLEFDHAPVPLPYIFSLKDDSTSEFNVLNFSLNITNNLASVDFKFFWGAQMSFIAHLMHSSWDELIDKLENAGNDESLENNNYLTFSQMRISTQCFNEKVKELSVNTPSQLDWTQISNTHRYPLTIFIYDKEKVMSPELNDDNKMNEKDSILGLIVLLHVKSTTFPMSSTVLGQYIKTMNGKILPLKNLYLSNIEEEAESEDGSHSQNAKNSENRKIIKLCTVCQTIGASRAILPCAHASICSHCFKRVFKCPICRGPILSFFRIAKEDNEIENILNTQTDTERLSWAEYFEQLNERLVNFLNIQNH